MNLVKENNNHNENINFNLLSNTDDKANITKIHEINESFAISQNIANRMDILKNNLKSNKLEDINNKSYQQNVNPQYQEILNTAKHNSSDKSQKSISRICNMLSNSNQINPISPIISKKDNLIQTKEIEEHKELFEEEANDILNIISNGKKINPTVH